jgi:hypothetical protein
LVSLGEEEVTGREEMDIEGVPRWRWVIVVGVVGEKHTRVALVRVLSKILALGNLQVRLGDDLVEGVCAAGELLAGVAVTKSISSVESPVYIIRNSIETYHRMCDCWSCSSFAVHLVLPQWHFPWKSVMVMCDWCGKVRYVQ